VKVINGLRRVYHMFFPRILPTRSTEKQWWNTNWLIWKGEHAVHALEQGDVERATQILRLKR